MFKEKMVYRRVPEFLNGNGMCRGGVHYTIAAQPFLGRVRNAELELRVIELADVESALTVAVRREGLGGLIWSTIPTWAVGATTDPDRTTAGHA